MTDCEGGFGCACYPNDTCDDGFECSSATCVASTGCEGALGCQCYPNDTCDAGLACTGGACVMASSGGGGAPPAGGAGAPPPPPPAASGPVFLSFSTSLTTLNKTANGGGGYAEDNVVFSAVLTDPDGIDDLIGGSLKDPASGNAYGTFATDAGEGAYSLMLTWDAINTVIPIDGKGGSSRMFRAEFFDQAGHVVTRDVTLMFVCANTSRLDLCDGECTTNATDVDNCGMCGRSCDVPNIFEQSCVANKCEYRHWGVTSTCAAFCMALRTGLVCDATMSRIEWQDSTIGSGSCAVFETPTCTLSQATATPATGCTFRETDCTCREP
jgi:hypothetical protein